MTVRLGADGTFSNVSTLKSLGATFISRYTSEQSWALTPSEAQALTNGGIDIVSNYEHYTTDYQGGFNQGVTNAHTGWNVHKRCGGPDNRPIYFSVDTDVNPSTSSLHAYFQGACSVLGVNNVGVYASTGVCNALKSAGLVKWTWRTMSTGWNGGAGTPAMFNVEQTGYFPGGQYDRDASITDDFGQWRVGQSPVTPPPPPPVTGLPVVSLAIVQMCANDDPSAPQGHTTNYGEVYPVQRALVAEGLLSDLNPYWGRGAWGTSTVAAYAKWQESLGFTGADADGHPGMTSLSKLALKHPMFTVAA